MTRDLNHARAQDLSFQAAMLLKEGRRTEARSRYGEAAHLERMAFSSVPPVKPRTRGVLAVSTASLFYKAKKLVDAEKFVLPLLADDDILPVHRKQLRELLEAIWDEQALPAGTSYSPEEIWISLRGGHVGQGTAPLELALTKGAELRNLMVRTAEWKNGEQFRSRGPPSKTVRHLVQARATQPQAGSYRFAIKLVEREQMEMFPGQEAKAIDIGEGLFDMMRIATSGSPNAPEELKSLIPSREYRQALVKLLRNVVPDDVGLREVELTRFSLPEGETEPRKEAVLLFSNARLALTQVLRRDEPPPEPGEAELRGVLRALHLDQNWLEILKDDSTHQRCETKDDVLDDVVGPMVNRRVVLRGIWSAGRKKFHLLDIEPETEK